MLLPTTKANRNTTWKRKSYAWNEVKWSVFPKGKGGGPLNIVFLDVILILLGRQETAEKFNQQ